MKENLMEIDRAKESYIYITISSLEKIVKQIEHLQEQLDIVTEQRNDIHIDKQVLQKQLNEANKLIKWVVKTSWTGNQEEDDFDRYLEKWGVK